MKAFAMLSANKVGWIEIPTPKCEPYDAICKPLALAPCTSDVHTVYEGALGDRKNLVLGHEGVGEIVEVGNMVRDLKPGDRVVVPAITPNWNTPIIQEGVPAQHSEGMLSGWKFSNIKDGVFAEFFHVNDADMNLAILPDSVPLEVAAMAPDMMTTGLHGAEMADIGFGDTVAVIGIGPVGLMAVAGAQLRGAGRIIVVGSRPKCVEVAQAYGATEAINYKNGSIVDQILKSTNGRGADSVIIAGGGSDILAQAIEIVKPGGTVSNINYFGEGDILPIPREAWGVGMSHKTIKGGLCPGGRVRMEHMLQLILNKRIDPSLMVTHVLHGLDKVEQGIMMMKDKDSSLIKPVVIV